MIKVINWNRTIIIIINIIIKKYCCWIEDIQDEVKVGNPKKLKRYDKVVFVGKRIKSRYQAKSILKLAFSCQLFVYLFPLSPWFSSQKTGGG